jgi:cation diffusion facilitator CzcD-associated flavoprotein CzcO
VLGDIDFTIDGKPLVFSDTVTYRGMMFNLAWVFGHSRASWTLRADLVGDFVCRLLDHIKEKGARSATPALRPEDEDIPLLSWIDPENSVGPDCPDKSRPSRQALTLKRLKRRGQPLSDFPL